jgi:hypothetical protein
MTWFVVGEKIFFVVNRGSALQAYYLTSFDIFLKASVPEKRNNSNKTDSKVVITAPSFRNLSMAILLSFGFRDDTQSSTITGM